MKWVGLDLKSYSTLERIFTFEDGEFTEKWVGDSRVVCVDAFARAQGKNVRVGDVLDGTIPLVVVAHSDSPPWSVYAVRKSIYSRFWVVWYQLCSVLHSLNMRLLYTAWIWGLVEQREIGTMLVWKDFLPVRFVRWILRK